MARFLRSMVLLIGSTLASVAPLCAQDNGQPPPPQPAPENVEKAEPPAKYERDSGPMLAHYLLATIATILIMVLVCMPIRRD